jgi:hypothetical protein
VEAGGPYRKINFGRRRNGSEESSGKKGGCWEKVADQEGNEGFDENDEAW